MTKIYKKRMQILRDNFPLFQSWDTEKLKRLCQSSKERVLAQDEVLFGDGLGAEGQFYVLLEGRLRVEKVTQVER